MGVSERVARGGGVVQSTQGGRGLQTTCSSARLPANQWPRRPLGVKLDRVEGMPAPATSQVQRADMRPEPGSVLGVGDTGRGWRGPGRHGNRYRQGASGAGRVTERTPSRLWGPGRPRLSLEERVGVCSPNTWGAWRAEGEAQRPRSPEAQRPKARRQETAQRGADPASARGQRPFFWAFWMPTRLPPAGESRLGLCHQFRPPGEIWKGNIEKTAPQPDMR